MSIPALTVKGYKPEDIKRLLSSNESFVVAIRLYLVYQVALGYSSRQLAEIHDISFKQITTWVHRFEAEGIDGLKNRKGRGRKSLLSKDKMQRIKTVVLKEFPSAHGYKAVKWTGPLLAKWIESKYGVKYQRAQVYNLLRGLGIEFHKKQGLVKTTV
ncbi:MAG: helix-turn-helix domain-containing protein [Chitinophagaceae bacterium]